MASGRRWEIKNHATLTTNSSDGVPGPSSRSRSLFAVCMKAPERLAIVERDVHEPGALSHWLDLRPREALLQSRSEPVERIGTQHIEGSVAIIGQRPSF